MTITKAKPWEQLKDVADDTPLYVRVYDESLECEIIKCEVITCYDIIDDYNQKCFSDDEEVDTDTAIQELADFDDSTQYYEIG